MRHAIENALAAFEYLNKFASQGTVLFRNSRCALQQAHILLKSFYILQRVITFFSGADLDHVFNVVDKYLAVADVAGV